MQTLVPWVFVKNLLNRYAVADQQIKYKIKLFEKWAVYVSFSHLALYQ